LHDAPVQAPVEEKTMEHPLLSIARLNTPRWTKYSGLSPKKGRKPETRVRIPAGAPFYRGIRNQRKRRNHSFLCMSGKLMFFQL